MSNPFDTVMLALAAFDAAPGDAGLASDSRLALSSAIPLAGRAGVTG